MKFQSIDLCETGLFSKTIHRWQHYSGNFFSETPVLGLQLFSLPHIICALFLYLSADVRSSKLQCIVKFIYPTNMVTNK